MSEDNRKQTQRISLGRSSIGALGKVEKPKNFKSTIKKLIAYLKAYKLSIIMIIVFAVGSSVFAILGPRILGKTVTKIYEGIVDNATGVDFKYISKIVVILITLYIVSAIFSFLQGFIVSGVAQKITLNMRKDISEKINRMPLKYFDTKNHGEVLSRVTNDVDTVGQSLNQVISQSITSVVTLMGILVLMFSISWIMTIVSALILPLSLGLMSIIIKKSQKYFKKKQEYLGKVNGYIEEMYAGHMIMKAFNGEEEAVLEFEKLNNTLYNSAWKSQFLSGMMMPIIYFVSNLGYVLVSILGGWLTIKRIIEVGDILAFIQYVRQFNQPTAQLAQISSVLQSTAAASERIFEFLEEEEETFDDKDKTEIEPNKITGEICFRDVSFGYNSNNLVINKFSVSIEAGQKVAIVGPTGAGKTTIVKLLMRFYDVQSGGILIDGKDIKEFRRDDLRNMFGMVLQDTWLFKGTIMENIRYGRLDATDEEVIEAAKLAYAHHFIKTLPDGYNMILNEETNNISQGQKQLLTIARAILAEPKILILDEATSSIDTRTEVLIQKAMENLMHKRTSFIIAHRLSTIRNADIILVMKDGDIIEKGKHDELLELDGFYASLCKSHFETVQVS